MKIMLVTDSKSVGKRVINILKKMYPENVYFLDYTKNIINIKYPSYDMRKHDGFYYINGKKIEDEFTQVHLKNIDIPENYIYKKSNENSDITLNQLEDIDEVISICEISDEGVVRFAKYIEDHNLIMDKCKYYTIYAIDGDDNIIGDVNHLKSFSELFANYKEKGFQCQGSENSNLAYLFYHIVPERLGYTHAIPIKEIPKLLSQKYDIPIEILRDSDKWTANLYKELEDKMEADELFYENTDEYYENERS